LEPLFVENIQFSIRRSKCQQLIWGQCYDFNNTFAEKMDKISAFLSQNTAIYAVKIIITLSLKKIAYFCRKLVKIAKNSDHP
jgi:hypothetical protein